MAPPFATDLELKHRAGYPLLYITAKEEWRALKEIQRVATSLNHPFFVWTATNPGGNPDEALKKAVPADGIYVLVNFHRYLDDPEAIQMLKDKREQLKSSTSTLIILSNILKLPPELEADFVMMEFSLPDKEMLAGMIKLLVEGNADITSLPDEAEMDRLTEAALGLTTWEAENAFALSLVKTKGKFDATIISQEKASIVKKSGLLEIYPTSQTMSEVGGLENLKSWLSERTGAFTDEARQFGLPMPKGVLLIGVPGCGKSLVAKSISTEWGLPLIKMDLGRLFAGIVGASEQNVRTAIQTAEAVAPCVLWIDEVEKGLSGLNSSGSTDSGVSSRVFGSIITWMQEKTRPVFLVMTANRVQSLPPEFLRAGRLDEIFFVDLPSSQEREEIFNIHLKKRGRDIKVSSQLLSETDGFSGAEIENVVVKGLYRAFNRKKNNQTPNDLTEEDLVCSAKSIVPLSKTRQEEIEAIREWAKSRAVFASTEIAPVEVGRKVRW